MTTGFLLGGGLAVLLAILGWSDRIRGSQEATRRQERELLQASAAQWQDLRALIRPSEDPSPEDKLASVLRMLKRGALNDHLDVHLIEEFERADEIRTELAQRYRERFWLVFALAVDMLVTGVISIYREGPIARDLGITWEGTFVTTWLVLITTILLGTFNISLKEELFREHLASIEDALRSAQRDLDRKKN